MQRIFAAPVINVNGIDTMYHASVFGVSSTIARIENIKIATWNAPLTTAMIRVPLFGETLSLFLIFGSNPYATTIERIIENIQNKKKTIPKILPSTPRFANDGCLDWVLSETSPAK